MSRMDQHPNIDTDDVMACPKCGKNNLQHGEVQVYNRRGEDKPGTRVHVAPPDNAISVSDTALGFAGRRSDVRIQFTCEGCDLAAWLYVIQHKGSTYIRWVKDSGNQVFP